MRDQPIIFSAPMVRALLDGRKSMTRHLFKRDREPPPKWDGRYGFSVLTPDDHVELRGWTDEKGPVSRFMKMKYAKGDRLWVREAHAYTSWDEDGQFIVDYLADDARSEWLSPDDGDVAQNLMERLCGQFDRAGIKLGPDGNYEKPAKRFGKPSIHMPRWASRLTLVVTGTKVERLQDISAADAEREGIPTHVVERTFRKVYRDDAERAAKRVEYFAELWKKLHGDAAWDENPEVVAVSFRVVKSNIDATAPTQATEGEKVA